MIARWCQGSWLAGLEGEWDPPMEVGEVKSQMFPMLLSIEMWET